MSAPAHDSSPFVSGTSFEAFWNELERRARLALPWKSVEVGLLTLRMVDSWSIGDLMSPDAISGLRGQAAALAEDESTRGPILAVLQAIAQANEAAVGQCMFAYGRALESEASWRLAMDAYAALLRLLPDSEPSMIARTFVRLGRCHQCLGSISDAESLLQLGREIARTADDVQVELLALMAMSRMAILRGNVPEGERIADEAFARASAAGLRSIQSRAFHERAAVAYYRNEPLRMLKLGLEALRLSDEETERYRILNDLAGALVLLGRLEKARELFDISARKAPEHVVRWAALLNLLDLEARSQNETAFEACFSLLNRVHLPPELATMF